MAADPSILNLMKKHGIAPKDGGDTGGDASEQDAFQQLLSAIEAKDVAAGTEALKNFIDICEGGGKYEGDGDEEPAEE